jgi:hypothetical protein
MGEVSLVKQLSGTEALESMLAELRKRLSRNCRFDAHMAYAGYRAEISVKFYPAASFIPPAEQEIEVDQVQEGAVLSQTATADVTVEIPVRPPNQVREEADMPTPVLSQDANGNPVEKWVKKPGRAPRNKIKGGHVDGGEPSVTMVPTAIPVSKDASV